MSKKQTTPKIIFSSSSEESDSGAANRSKAVSTNSNLNQDENNYSDDYEYSYSSDFNIPQIKQIQRKTNIPLSNTPNARQKVFPPKRIASPFQNRPKPLSSQTNSALEQSSETITNGNNIEVENNNNNNNFSDQLNHDENAEIQEAIDTKDVQIKSNQHENNHKDQNNDTEAIDSCETLSFNDTINSTTNSFYNNTQQNTEHSENIPIDTNIQEETKEENNDKIYISYFCKKTAKMDMKSPYDFALEHKNEIIYYAKSKGIFSSNVYISSNENFNIKEKQYEYVLKITKNRSHFSLQKANENTDLLIMIFDNDYGKEYGPRKISMEWPLQNLKYHSRIPQKTEDGEWKMSFRGKYLVVSQKNAIILNENSKPVIIIRKILKRVLQIELIQNIDPIYMFAFGIASFICPF